jgi:hypothetical protein
MRLTLGTLALLVSCLVLPRPTGAETAEEAGRKIAAAVNGRPRAERATRVAMLTLIDSDEERRQRQLLTFWKLEPGVRRLVVFALSPPEMKHSAFLAIDRFDASRPDDEWYYKPQRKRAQRVPSSNRGESFLGSDFSFEDLKREDLLQLDEYHWKKLGEEKLAGRSLWKLEQVPVTSELAGELGYARIVSWVDPEILLRRRIEFFDVEGALLKTFDLRDIEQVDGIWTARRIEATHHRTRHRSLLVYSRIDYQAPIVDETFTPRTLEAERSDRLGAKAP